MTESREELLGNLCWTFSYICIQTPQAARIGQKWLEKGDAAITDYGLIRRKDGGLLPHFHPEQERQIQQRRGGMEMR